MSRTVIIGAGVGGLAAAIRLARRGGQVIVVEARDRPGGLAAGLELDGWSFDAGPYILLDRRGLEWALHQLELDPAMLELQRISQVYEVNAAGEPLRVSASLNETAEEIERRWPGAGSLYRQFITRMQARYQRLQPLQCSSPPRLAGLVRSGRWRDIPFLLRSLAGELAASRLPRPVVEAIGVWTHVAGQTMSQAPSPLALVPAVIHSEGAYCPRAGVGAIPAVLFATARRLGVEFRLATMVQRVRCRGTAAEGVELADGEFLPADAVVSNVGLGTYLKLLDEDARRAIPARAWRTLTALPLQSPGVCAYLAVKGRVEPPYLRFHLEDQPDGCRLLIAPAVLDASLTRDGWSPARLVAPLGHERAEAGGETAQRVFLERVLAEDWWRRPFEEVRVLATRIPQEWGQSYHLFHNSMNPVMTARFMRAGRLAHRSPWIRRLYLTGSATHPGQWVSFCAVAGVLTADRVLEDQQD